MKSGLAWTGILLALLCASRVSSQESASSTTPPAPLTPSPAFISVPAGKEIVLELRDPINTNSTRQGAKVTLINTVDVFALGRVVVPKGSVVHATVAESKRPGRLFGKARIRLAFDEVELADGSRLSLSAALNRSGWWGSKGSIDQTVKGEGGKSHDTVTIAETAAQGAIIGGLTRGSKGAAEGAAAGAVVSMIFMALQRGPDLDLPPGMMFEIELTKPLDVPLAAVEAAERASETAKVEEPPPMSAVAKSPVETTPAATPKPESPVPPSDAPRPEDIPVAATSQPAPAPENAAPQNDASPPADIPAVSANKPVTQQQTSPAPATSPITVGAGGYVLKMDVNLVLVEATVRDSRGGIADGLTRDDFQIFEDGAEQPIQYFSRDELPLAVAIVIDRSGSIAPYLSELRDAALETLTELKPDDQVALFAFDARPERLEYLSTDRQRIARAISNVSTGGGTNITDALYTAALYLGRAASRRRHAVILISDNQGTVRGFESDKDLVRMALETETVIYSIRVGGTYGLRGLSQPWWVPGTPSVNKVTHETGGEIIDGSQDRSLGAALAMVISRLKKRYTFGYLSPSKKRDGAFHSIEIKLAGASAAQDKQYTIFARRGYYAPIERVAARDKSR